MAMVVVWAASEEAATVVSEAAAAAAVTLTAWEAKEAVEIGINDARILRQKTGALRRSPRRRRR